MVGSNRGCDDKAGRGLALSSPTKKPKLKTKANNPRASKKTATQPGETNQFKRIISQVPTGPAAVCYPNNSPTKPHLGGCNRSAKRTSKQAQLEKANRTRGGGSASSGGANNKHHAPPTKTKHNHGHPPSHPPTRRLYLDVAPDA